MPLRSSRATNGQLYRRRTRARQSGSSGCDPRSPSAASAALHDQAVSQQRGRRPSYQPDYRDDTPTPPLEPVGESPRTLHVPNRPGLTRHPTIGTSHAGPLPAVQRPCTDVPVAHAWSVTPSRRPTIRKAAMIMAADHDLRTHIQQVGFPLCPQRVDTERCRRDPPGHRWSTQRCLMLVTGTHSGNQQYRSHERPRYPGPV